MRRWKKGEQSRQNMYSKFRSRDISSYKKDQNISFCLTLLNLCLQMLKYFPVKHSSGGIKNPDMSYHSD